MSFFFFKFKINFSCSGELCSVCDAFFSNTIKHACGLACNPRPLSAHQQNAICMAFCWWADSGPMLCLLGSYLCFSSMSNKFPSKPLFPDMEFVTEDHDNITTYQHWRSEFYLFTLDYYFHASNGLPYK